MSELISAKTDALFSVYGDESITDNAVVYALAIVPVNIQARAEGALIQAKQRHGVPASAELHCRELFHKDARRKSAWAALSDEDAFSFAEELAGSLVHNGVSFRIGFVDRTRAPKEIVGGGPLKTTSLGAKQLVLFAFAAAVGPLDRYPGFQRIRFWADPDHTKIDWFGRKRQAQRNYEMFSDISGAFRSIKSELIQQDKPVLLQAADFAAYIASHALSKTYRGDKGRFINLYRILRPEKMDSSVIADSPVQRRPEHP